MSSQEDRVVIDLPGLLQAWDLTEYLSNFREHMIDLDQLPSLIEPCNEAILHQLVPRLGHSMRLKQQIRNLFQNVQQSNSNLTQQTRPSPSSTMSRQDSEEFNPDEFLNFAGSSIENANKELSSGSASTSEDTSKSTRGEKSDADPTAQSVTLPEKLKDRDTSKAHSSSSRRETSTPERTPTNSKRKPREAEDKSNKVRTILSQSGYGRGILHLARTSYKLREDSDRNRLCELVIDHLLSKENEYKLKSDDFIYIVNDIKEIFPDEDEATYYIPYKKSGNVKCLAKGKLILKYQTIRKYLKASGVITSKSETEKEDESLDGEEFDVQDIESKLNYLRQNLDDWIVVTEYWKETSKFRIRNLRSSPHLLSKTKRPKKGEEGTALTVAAYVALFPCLKDVQGYQLFVIDFDLEYPRFKNAIFSGWDDFISKALDALKAIQKPCPALSDNLLLIEDGIHDKEVNDAIVLLSLGYLDAVVTVTRIQKEKKFTAWRPPHPEIQEGTDGKAETFILNRFKKFENWKLSVQPFCVAVGLTVDAIEKCFVVLDKTTKFEFNSVQRGLDVCFKILHASHARYSEESYRLWMLIQLKLYKLETKYDRNDSQLPKLLSKFD